MVIVMDGSGSIHPSQFREMKSGAQKLLDALAPGSMAGVVQFSDAATDDVPLALAGPATRAAIDQIAQRRSNTNTHLGIDAGHRMLGKCPAGMPRAMVLITDGAPTTGDWVDSITAVKASCPATRVVAVGAGNCGSRSPATAACSKMLDDVATSKADVIRLGNSFALEKKAKEIAAAACKPPKQCTPKTTSQVTQLRTTISGYFVPPPEVIATDPEATPSPNPTTKAPTKAPTKTAKCADAADAISCEGWTELGQCEQNPGFMLQQCRRSCGECGEEGGEEEDDDNKGGEEEEDRCADSDGGCYLWADAGECEQNSDWMLKKCRKSCGVCTPPPTLAPTDASYPPQNETPPQRTPYPTAYPTAYPTRRSSKTRRPRVPPRYNPSPTPRYRPVPPAPAPAPGSGPQREGSGFPGFPGIPQFGGGGGRGGEGPPQR